MFSNKKTIAYIQVIWLLSLITLSCLVYLKQLFISIFFNSDHLLFPYLFKDIFLNHGSFNDWFLSPAPHFFPDSLIFFIAFILTKKIYFQFLITLCLLQLLMYLAIRNVYCQIFNKEKAILFSLASISFFYIILFKNLAYYTIFALVPTTHVSEFIVGTFLIGIQLKIINNFKKNNAKNGCLSLIIILLSFLCSLSDVLFLIQFTLAFFCAYFILFVKKIIKLKPFVYYASSPLLVSILGGALTKYIVPHNVLFGYLNDPNFNKLLTNILNLKWSLFFILLKKEITLIPGFVFVFFYCCLFFLLLFLLKKNRNCFSVLDIKTLYLTSFLLTSSGLSILACLLLNYENAVLSRYMYPLFYYPFLLFFYPSAIVSKCKSVYAGLYFISIVLGITLIAVVLSLIIKSKFKLKLNYYPGYVGCIDKALKGHDTHGIAPYWYANLISLLSKNNLEIVPVLPDLSEFYWSISQKKFHHSYSFYIINKDMAPGWTLDQRLIEANYGKAQKIVRCGDKDIYIYPNNLIKIPVLKK